MSYDHVAEDYESFPGANGYAALATDLVDLLNLPSAGAMLDVGCGTGAAALAARKAVGPGVSWSGLTCRSAMLRRASARGLTTVTAGSLPELPFRTGVFDGVAASLELSHLDTYEAAADVGSARRGGVLVRDVDQMRTARSRLRSVVGVSARLRATRP
jgi:ubiquinone/menaquinone biosynthesis C-methylase UbiE